MTDRRLTPFSGRVAHVSLRGQIEAPFTEGQAAQVVVPVADLLAAPDGPRDRQLLLGAALTVIDRDRGHVFIRAERDGYCGWLDQAAVGQGPAPTHWVAAPATQVLAGPVVQAKERMSLSLGSRVAVLGTAGQWARTPQGFIPLPHLLPLDRFVHDPVAVAESLLGTPYLWGGNSRLGVDCSGLVQLAFHACGRPCPGDSDMQAAMGRALATGAAVERGDLIFWKGHVAMAVSDSLLIHANGHTMSVAHERIDVAIERIAAAGGGPVLARRRC